MVGLGHLSGHSCQGVLTRASCLLTRAWYVPCSSTFKYPWARVLCYKGGLGKSGKQQLQEVARYPSEIMNQYCGSTYPALVLPFNKIHLKAGGCSVRPSKIIRTLSLPSNFPLSLAFIHALCTHSLSVSKENPSSELALLCARALSICLESLCKLVTRLEMPERLKERTLHLLSEVIWTLCGIAPTGLTPVSLSTDFLQGVRQELLQLYELEVGKFSKAKQKTSYPPPGSISDGGQGKFSTYLQSLLECYLATSTYQQQFHGVEPDTSFSPSTSSGLLASTSPPPDPVKKSMRRFRARRGGTRKDTSESDPRKREEWLGVVRSASSVLLSLTAHSQESDLRLPKSHSEASLAGSLPVHPNTKLIVVTGIPPDLSVDEAKTSVRRVCQSYSGLYNDELYLPVRDIPTSTMEEREGGDRGSTELKQTPHCGGEDGTVPAVGQEMVPSSEQLIADTPTSSQPQASQETTCPTQQLVGQAVLELNYSSNTSVVCDALLSLASLQREDTSLSVAAVSNTLVCSEEETANKALDGYLTHKLIEGGKLTLSAVETLKCVFGSVAQKEKEGLMEQEVSGDLLLFFAGFSGGKGSGRDVAGSVWKEILGEREKSCVSVQEFLQWCAKQAASSAVRVWQGLFACGYDLHFTRYR